MTTPSPAPALKPRKPPQALQETLQQVRRQDVLDLVQIHATLEKDKLLTAIWIYQDSDEVWLVEVISDMLDDDRAEVPFTYGPEPRFRYPLRLITANEKSMREAIRRAPELAAAIVEGDMLHDIDQTGARFREIARAVAHGSA